MGPNIDYMYFNPFLAHTLSTLIILIRGLLASWSSDLQKAFVLLQTCMCKSKYVSCIYHPALPP
jgi:hypothetical protein